MSFYFLHLFAFSKDMIYDYIYALVQSEAVIVFCNIKLDYCEKYNHIVGVIFTHNAMHLELNTVWLHFSS